MRAGLAGEVAKDETRLAFLLLHAGWMADVKITFISHKKGQHRPLLRGVSIQKTRQPSISHGPAGLGRLVCRQSVYGTTECQI